MRKDGIAADVPGPLCARKSKVHDPVNGEANFLLTGDGGLLGCKAPDWSLSKAGETERGDAREVVLIFIILNYRMTHCVLTGV